jgi:ATP-dependent exoDNAse (exonuclease V) alpha subunit
MRISNISKVAVDCTQYSQSTFTLSVHQQEVLERVEKFRRSNKPYFYLAGFAGTGKTEIITRLGRDRDDVRYVAFTGKAASVLRQRGATNATTIHSFLYGAPTVLTHKYGQLLRWKRRPEKINASLIVADECSMIDHKLAEDLIATGVKIVMTGEWMQLPPIKGEPYFTRPDFVLTEIHRQAAGSQPLKLATAIREGKQIKPQRFDIDRIMDADIVICAFEKTRRYLNQMIRRARGIKDNDPVVGDRVCCFRNNRDSGVLNGTLWSVENVEEFTDKVVTSNGTGGMRTETQYLYRLQLVDDVGNTTTVVVEEDYFYGADPRGVPYDGSGLDIFSFGYALTCHKSQGSEWDRVVVIDQTRSYGFENIIGTLTLAEFRQRWLYTGITRAKEHVTLMEPPA